MNKRYTIGIDEVGRGPLAGPLVVAALALPAGHRLQIPPSLKKRIQGHKSRFYLGDSKQLRPAIRCDVAEFIKNDPTIKYQIIEISPKKIDEINILQACHLAATEAYLALIRSYGIDLSVCEVILDGGLILHPRAEKSFRSIIRGDAKYSAIKYASIIAKVYRDNLMKEAHQCYPHYDFIHNQGYGTKAHMIALSKYGPTALHRTSFITSCILPEKLDRVH